LGEADELQYDGPDGEGHREKVLVLETNIDDATPEQLAFLSERLEEQGAWDVSIFPGVGKKSRPVHLLRVVAQTSLLQALVDCFMTHSSTLGLRYQEVSRLCLDRSFETVTVLGEAVRVKVAHWQGRRVRCEPEFEDCARVARATGRSLMDIQQAARQALS
jgi:uncharacterized protein (DUF111 family)